MIRFLDFKGQIVNGEESFAFYDTVSDSIIYFAGEQVFDSVKEFKEFYQVDSKLPFHEKQGSKISLKRLMSLMPNRLFMINSNE